MSNTDLAAAFYEAFSRKDYKTMQSLYAENAVFTDPVFQKLSATEVKGMWEMLISRGKDMSVDYKVEGEQGNIVSVGWTAVYTFSATGRRVVNHINAQLTIEDGKIVAHTDYFPFRKWARQALGFQGILFGSTSFLKNKVRTTARQNLDVFLAKKSGH